MLILFFWLIGLGVVLVRLRTDRTGFFQFLAASFYLLVIVEVIGYEFVGYYKSRPKVPLESDKAQHYHVDSYKKNKDPSIVGFSCQ
jgi:hypothetical protein